MEMRARKQNFQHSKHENLTWSFSARKRKFPILFYAFSNEIDTIYFDDDDGLAGELLSITEHRSKTAINPRRTATEEIISVIIIDNLWNFRTLSHTNFQCRKWGTEQDRF